MQLRARSPLWLLPLRTGVLLAVLAWAGGLLEASGFPWCLLVHGRGLLAAGLLVLVPLLVIDRRPRWALAALVTMLLAAWSPATAAWPEVRASAAGIGSIRVVQANLLYANKDESRAEVFLDWVRELDPDLLAVEEQTAWWQRRLSGLRERLPHYRGVTQEDSYGVGLYSRWPIAHCDLPEVGAWKIPEIRARVNTPHGPLSVIVVHVLPPGGPEMTRGREFQVRALGRTASRTPGSLLVCGDFNHAPWSLRFRNLLGAGRLEDARQGQGPCHSWPDTPLVGVLGVAIDGILSRGLLVPGGFIIGPSIGSDHRPVFGRFLVTGRL